MNIIYKITFIKNKKINTKISENFYSLYETENALRHFAKLWTKNGYYKIAMIEAISLEHNDLTLNKWYYEILCGYNGRLEVNRIYDNCKIYRAYNNIDEFVEHVKSMFHGVEINNITQLPLVKFKNKRFGMKLELVDKTGNVLMLKGPGGYGYTTLYELFTDCEYLNGHVCGKMFFE